MQNHQDGWIQQNLGMPEWTSEPVHSVHYPLQTCYDSIVDKSQLKYQGSILVTCPVNPPTFTLSCNYMTTYVNG
jgi:hypothetical protein